MFGSHLSIAGGLHHAITAAVELDMDCVQVFTKNQRQWSAPPLSEEQIAEWHRRLKRSKLKQTVSHDSYLINLASPKKENLAKSIALFRDELLRCEALAIPWLVTHPGAHMGEGEDVGLHRVTASLDQLHDELPGLKTVTLLEVTAGQGTTLGWRFEHLRSIIENVREPERLGVCLDTAHLLAAGYDLTSAKGARGVLDELDEVIGLPAVHCVHVNDSKVERGRRVDRHDHIGRGHVAMEAFRVFVNHPRLKRVPKILETPKEDGPDGRPWDAINLEVLRGLVRTRRKKK